MILAEDVILKYGTRSKVTYSANPSKSLNEYIHTKLGDPFILLTQYFF
jgi:hypothetical protein